MRRDEPLPADFRINNESGVEPKPPLSRAARVELLCAICFILAWFSVKPALERYLDARTEAVQTYALNACRPPAEFEQLHVVVLNRAGALVAGDCLYVSGPGGYRP